MKSLTVALCALVVSAVAVEPAMAQSMPLNTFITTADRIPRNPTALLRSDFRRLRREFQAAVNVVARAQHEAKMAGRTPATCIPREIELDPEEVLAGLKTIPDARRRSMTITDGVRDYMVRLYPCPRA